MDRQPESLFLALALPGWLAARRGHWVRSGILVGLASTIRINGLFVAVAVGVLFFQSRPHGPDWRRAPALLLPVGNVPI